jgi:hypothetical protein
LLGPCAGTCPHRGVGVEEGEERGDAVQIADRAGTGTRGGRHAERGCMWVDIAEQRTEAPGSSHSQMKAWGSGNTAGAQDMGPPGQVS